MINLQKENLVFLNSIKDCVLNALFSRWDAIKPVQTYVNYIWIMDVHLIFVMQESYLNPEFLRIVRYAKSSQATFKGLLSLPDIKAHSGM